MARPTSLRRPPERRPRAYRRWFAVLIGAVALVLVGAALPISAGTSGVARAQTEVIGDDERDLFVGTGSLLLPVDFTRPGRDAASDCPGCSWKATLLCDPVSPTACRGKARLCPDDRLWLRISLARPGLPWESVGSGCFDPGGPVSRDTVEYLLADLVARSVPALRPAMRPRAGALPHLPVAFTAGQSGDAQGWEWMIAGLTVRVVATPTWRWRFEPGGPTISHRSPGEDDRSSPVHHSYSTSGARVVEVASVWSAQYWVGDLGPLPVADPVVQTAGLDVSVGEARAVLVR